MSYPKLSYMVSDEFAAISDFYGDRRAKRSGVHLIDHIIEGCQLLNSWGRSTFDQRIFCIHPLVQENETIGFELDERIERFATEYKQKANRYLCRPDTDWIVDPTDLQNHLGNMTQCCAWLLLADKVQNQKDFREYHWFTHERSTQLERYFNVWIETLRTYYL